jgi:hypothetical protein
VVRIGEVRIGPTATASAVAVTRSTTQMFPRARFQELGEHERLTQKSFEAFAAGVAITPAGQANPAGAATDFDFEPVTLAPETVTKLPPTRTFPGDAQWHLRRGRAARSEVRQAERLLRGVPAAEVVVEPPAVVVVDHRTLADPLHLDEVEARSPTLAGQRAGTGQLVVEAHEIGV